MARFIGIIQGQRGDTSRLGSAKSGLMAKANGWNIGARIYLSVDPTTGKDTIDIILTGGTNGNIPPRHLGTFTEEEEAKK
jgi:hypothetical protein